MQVRAPQDYRLVFSDPPNCAPSTCNIFVGIDTNAGNGLFLDIYMEGNTQGWVAVGFSDSASMVQTLIIMLIVKYEHKISVLYNYYTCSHKVILVTEI